MDLKLVYISVIFLTSSVVESADIDITKGPPPYDKPWVPAWGWFGSGQPLRRKNYNEKLLNQTRDHKENIKIVFLGDSKTEGWSQEGKPVFDEYYTKRGGFNYGVGGDSTRQVLWRVENKELDGLDAKIVVFFIGGNNFYNDFNKGTDEEIVKAENVIFEKVREKVPNVQIILVAQTPRAPNRDDNRARDINSLWEKEPKSIASYVHYLNPYDKYLLPNGTQNTNLFIGDHIHLNKEGFEILAQSLEPLIKKYLE